MTALHIVTPLYNILNLSHTTDFSVSPPVRLAYDSIDSNSDGEDLPPLVILHGLFGSKTNWRTLARHFHKQTGRKVTLKLQFLLCCKIKYVYIYYIHI